MINFQNDFFLQNYWGIARQVIFGNKTFPNLLVKVAASGIAAMVGDAKGGWLHCKFRELGRPEDPGYQALRALIQLCRLCLCLFKLTLDKRGIDGIHTFPKFKIAPLP